VFGEEVDQLACRMIRFLYQANDAQVWLCRLSNLRNLNIGRCLRYNICIWICTRAWWCFYVAFVDRCGYSVVFCIPWLTWCKRFNGV
jgi:hypothetical protein